MNELMALDDRMLADIGLTRGSVEHAVRYGRLPSAVHDSVPGSLTARRNAQAGIPWSTPRT
jgi:hypothetical protein